MTPALLLVPVRLVPVRPQLVLTLKLASLASNPASDLALS